MEAKLTDTFNLTVEKQADYAIIRTDGYINNLGGEKISDTANEIINSGITRLILNFEKSTVVNSIGISILIEVIEKIIEIEGKILFSNLTKTIAKTFNIMGLTQYADICETESEAINKIGG